MCYARAEAVYLLRASSTGGLRSAASWYEKHVAKTQGGRPKGGFVLILGIILLILGFVFGVPILWTIGIILAIIGAILWLAEGAGAAWGRRWY